MIHGVRGRRNRGAVSAEWWDILGIALCVLAMPERGMPLKSPAQYCDCTGEMRREKSAYGYSGKIEYHDLRVSCSTQADKGLIRNGYSIAGLECSAVELHRSSQNLNPSMTILCERHI